MSLEHDIDRGNRANGLLNSLAFTEALAAVERAIHEAWANAPIRDIEGQQYLKLQLKILGDVRANLEQAIADGKIAAAEIDRRNKPRFADFRR